MKALAGLGVFVVFVSVVALGGESSIEIRSAPPGASVELEDRVVCAATPCSVSLPDYYFPRHLTFWSQRLTYPVRITLRKEGYRSKTVVITEGPKRWQGWNTRDYFDYYNVTQREFSLTLQKHSQESKRPVVDR